MHSGRQFGDYYIAENRTEIAARLSLARFAFDGRVTKLWKAAPHENEAFCMMMLSADLPLLRSSNSYWCMQTLIDTIVGRRLIHH